MLAAQAGIAVAARGDGTRNDPLPLLVAHHRRPELFDDAHGLMADREPLPDRILAPENMYIRAANRGRRYPHERIEGTDIRDRLGVEDDSVGLGKDRRLHLGHDQLLVRDHAVGRAIHLGSLAHRSPSPLIYDKAMSVRPWRMNKSQPAPHRHDLGREACVSTR